MSELYDLITSRENLYKAAKRALKGKLSNARFYSYSVNLSNNVEYLYKQIQKGTYRPHSDKEFDLWCISGQKVRHIVAPSIDDLIVQHAIYQIIVPIIDPKLIYDSYGCRVLKGSHKASDRCQYFLRKSPKDSYFLQLDIKKYYYNLDHTILKEALLHLLGEQDVVDFIALQFPQDKTIGMNVGAMISQLMGMIYLNKFDQYCKRVLKLKRIIRYVDDIVIIGLSKEKCFSLVRTIEQYLKTELKLSFSKVKILPISKGINFVGHRTWQQKRIIRKRSYKVFNKNLKKNKVDSLQSCLGHALKTSSYKTLIKRIETKSIHLLPLLTIQKVS